MQTSRATIEKGTEERPRSLKLEPYEKVLCILVSSLSGRQIPVEQLSVAKAFRRICTETVRSRADIPRHHNAAMDGYAVNSSATTAASPLKPVRLLVKGVSPYRRKRGTIASSESQHVPTGANLPKGADAVARLERVRKVGGSYIELTRPVEPWKDVLRSGEDVHRGDVLFGPGHIMNASDVALGISAGVDTIDVYGVPRVAIISVGENLARFRGFKRRLRRRDEGKTYNNFCNLISCYLDEYGAAVGTTEICPPDASKLRASVRRCAASHDLVITIGGSSVGMNDETTDSVFSMPGSNPKFHGVRMLPVRPVGFAVVGRTPVAILPAKSVSLALSFYLIVVPILNLLSGADIMARFARVSALASEGFANEKTLDALYLVKLQRDGSTFVASPLGFCSNMLGRLSSANGFVLLQKGEKVKKGETLDVRLLGPIEALRIRSDTGRK